MGLESSIVITNETSARRVIEIIARERIHKAKKDTIIIAKLILQFGFPTLRVEDEVRYGISLRIDLETQKIGSQNYIALTQEEVKFFRGLLAKLLDTSQTSDAEEELSITDDALVEV